METKLLRLAALVLPLFALTVGCNDDEEKQADRIALEGSVTEVVFTPESATSQTVSLTSNVPWSVSLGDVQWVDVTPARGDAGKTDLTVRLIDLICDADREATATFVAGTAKTTLRIVQKAPLAAQGIAITAAQKKLLAGTSTQLTVEVEPVGSILKGVVWSSSDPAVLTVSDAGLVEALAVGTATVTAQSGALKAECPMEVTEVFTTDGEGRSYSFADLAALVGTPVEGNDGTYAVMGDMVVSAGDVLTLADGETIRMADGVEIRVLGQVDFTPENGAVIEPFAEGAVPEPLYFTDDAAGGVIANVEINGLPIRYFGGSPLKIEGCTFTGVADKYASINLGGSGQVSVTECEFLENGYPAIMGGANTTTPLLFVDNFLYNNSNNARNRPQINVTVAGDGKVEIIGNTVIGPGEVTMNGGIAVANMLGIAGTNEVVIEGNEVSDCRYGITVNGVMDVRIIDNDLRNNKWDSNPMNGGSGVSIYHGQAGAKVFMSGNIIEGHLWGITNIGGSAGASLNMGNQAEGADNNPGGNVFRNNGNSGVLYDLYNNSTMTVYAQGNTWNVATQDAESIETVIFHKADDPSLGEVIYMPAAQ